MSGTAAGTQLTLLDAAGPLDEQALLRRYAYQDGTRTWVRANMIASLDGAATSAGRSGALGGPGDRLVFATLRHLADVVLVGAATVRAEDYGGARQDRAGRRARLARGQAEVPPIAVVTRTAALDPDARLFGDTAVAPLILTCRAAAGSARSRFAGLAEVLDASGADPEHVDCAVALRLLAERGLRRVLTEGGPTLLGQLAAAGLLDELCLTVAPVLAGGDGPRILAGSLPPARLRLRHTLTDTEGYLYLRYAAGRD